jgi:hypothetical protein
MSIKKKKWFFQKLNTYLIENYLALIKILFSLKLLISYLVKSIDYRNTFSTINGNKYNGILNAFFPFFHFYDDEFSRYQCRPRC